jgi:hypothetical protein
MGRKAKFSAGTKVKKGPGRKLKKQGEPIIPSHLIGEYRKEGIYLSCSFLNVVFYISLYEFSTCSFSALLCILLYRWFQNKNTHFYAFCCTDDSKIKKPVSRRQKQRALKRAKKRAEFLEKRNLSRSKSKQQLPNKSGKEYFCALYMLCIVARFFLGYRMT